MGSVRNRTRSRFCGSFSFDDCVRSDGQSIALYIEHNWVVDTGLTSNQRISEASKLTGYSWWLLRDGGHHSGGLIGRLSRRFGSLACAVVGLCIMTIGLALIPIVGSSGSYVSLLMVAPFLATGMVC